MKTTTDELQRKILCIGNDPEMLTLYQLVIAAKLTNVDVTCAPDGEQGLQIALENKPDLIIIDGWHLPDVGDRNLEDSGPLTSKLRNELHPHILAILILQIRQSLGDVDPPNGWFALARDPLNGVLIKPLYIPEFIKKVKSLLETVDRKRTK
jgi:DNA-binding response OmpR family regulator